MDKWLKDILPDKVLLQQGFIQFYYRIYIVLLQDLYSSTIGFIQFYYSKDLYSSTIGFIQFYYRIYIVLLYKDLYSSTIGFIQFYCSKDLYSSTIGFIQFYCSKDLKCIQLYYRISIIPPNMWLSLPEDKSRELDTFNSFSMKIKYLFFIRNIRLVKFCALKARSVVKLALQDSYVVYWFID